MQPVVPFSATRLEMSDIAVGIVRHGGFAGENYKRVFQHACLPQRHILRGIRKRGSSYNRHPHF
jgi:hypothetical protein